MKLKGQLMQVSHLWQNEEVLVETVWGRDVTSFQIHQQTEKERPMCWMQRKVHDQK